MACKLLSVIHVECGVVPVVGGSIIIQASVFILYNITTESSGISISV